jgi:hypothetical protein
MPLKAAAVSGSQMTHYFADQDSLIRAVKSIDRPRTVKPDVIAEVWQILSPC